MQRRGEEGKGLLEERGVLDGRARLNAGVGGGTVREDWVRQRGGRAEVVVERIGLGKERRLAEELRVVITGLAHSKGGLVSLHTEFTVRSQ